MLVIALVAVIGGFAAEIPKAPVPPSPYLPLIYKYADAMLEHGNPQHGENFLRLLYTLSELSGKPKYREAADVGLRRFLEQQRPLEFTRPWVLWDRCFEIAPKASESVVRALMENQNTDARHTGFHIRAWAVAYAHTKDERFLTAIAESVERFEQKRDPSASSMLSLAIDCDAASRYVPQTLASKLPAFATREDKIFCKQNSGDSIRPQLAMMCVSRYENTGNVAYRDLIHRAADVYLKSSPTNSADAWPRPFGHAISLQLAAWRSTARQEYLDRARSLADFAVKHFFDQGPLPGASLKTSHYESITDADTLALALVELHLHILHITAVRWAPNTIDR